MTRLRDPILDGERHGELNRPKFLLSDVTWRRIQTPMQPNNKLSKNWALRSVGIAALILVLSALVVGGWYFLRGRKKKPDPSGSTISYVIITPVVWLPHAVADPVHLQPQQPEG